MSKFERTSSLFIDLPNFYSHLLKSGIAEPRFLRDYSLYWLDFDLLAAALTDSLSGIWIFYSGGRIGPSSERIDGTHLKDYINRINALEGVTARDVNIPGEQREHLKMKCENCGQEQTGEYLSEKGIDASLTVHLFDTMEAWDVAYLLSGDADFGPAVASLRRRGKIVVGAGFPDRSSVLARECFNYVDLLERFLARDVAAYAIFRKSDGIIWKWFNDDLLSHRPDDVMQKRAQLQFFWNFHSGKSLSRGNFPHFSGYLSEESASMVDLSSRHEYIRGFQARFPNQEFSIHPVHGTVAFEIDSVVGAGVERRLPGLLASIQGLQPDEDGLRTSHRMEYRYDDDEGKFIPILQSEE